MSGTEACWLALAWRPGEGEAAAAEKGPLLPPHTAALSAALWEERALGDVPLPAPAPRLLLCDAAAPLRLPDATGTGWRWSGIPIGPGRATAPAGAGGLLVNAMDIDAAHEEEFNDWYDGEHLPRIAAVDGVILARRFRSEKDSPRYLATYHLRDLAVVAAAEWKAAANTPWTARMRRYRTGLIRKGFVPVAA